MLDAIAEAEGIKMNTIQHKALTGKGGRLPFVAKRKDLTIFVTIHMEVSH